MRRSSISRAAAARSRGSSPSRVAAETGKAATPRSLRAASRAGQCSRAAGQVHLVRRHDLGPRRQLGGVLAQLRVDPLEVFERAPTVDAGGVQDVNQEAGPLQVAQEAQPQPGAFARPFDQAGDVRHDEALVVDADDAEVRLERGEGVIGDLGSRRRDRREQGGLAGVGVADQADVGDDLQLQLDVALLPRLAAGGELRRALHRRGEVHVAQAALAAAGDHHPLAVLQHVRQQLAARHVSHHRPDGDGDGDVRPGPAVALGRAAGFARLALEDALEAEGEQGVLGAVALDVDAAPAPAVAAVRAAAGDELLAAHVHRPVAALAGQNVDLGEVVEHRPLRLVRIELW